MTDGVIANGAAPSVVMAEGVARKCLGWGERTLIAEVRLAKGSLVGLHSHPHEQIGYVAQGTLEFTIGDKVQIARQGDGYVIPGNTLHAVQALDDSIAVDIFSPVREEYK